MCLFAWCRKNMHMRFADLQVLVELASRLHRQAHNACVDCHLRIDCISITTGVCYGIASCIMEPAQAAILLQPPFSLNTTGSGVHIQTAMALKQSLISIMEYGPQLFVNKCHISPLHILSKQYLQ